MRKLFLALMLSSALGAVVIGSALAWTGTSSASTSAQAGSIAFGIDPYVATANVVNDNNTWVTVANGGIHNTGTVAIGVASGTVLPIGISATCGVYGQVVVDNPGLVAPTATVGGLYHVDLAMPPQGGNNTCQGQVLPYTLTINVAS